MSKNYLIYFLLIISSYSIYAQKEASYWFFGENAGLDFSSGIPIADTNGSLNTLEGCATISNVLGELLFYTDGTSVWNREHTLMPTGIGLNGDSSSSQSAIIVPKPDDINIYYIFTVDWALGDKGLNFYTVDMKLDGGLGDVVGFDNVPTATKLLDSPISEKITAVKVIDQDAFWVISYRGGVFHVFKVDANGVDTNAVITDTEFSDPIDPRGYLKSSPDGTMLISANMGTGTFIYDFDSATGVISNSRQLDLLGEFAYGVEFSPLSKKLYISTGNLTFDNETGEINPAIEKLFQFSLDIPTPTSAKLNETRVELHSYVNTRAALQLGVDGKIYRAIDRTNFLGVINNPEGDGTEANYIHNSIDLGGKISRQGLPPFIQSFFVALIQIENQCLGDISRFTIESNEPILSILWNFGDGSTSTDQSPTHTYVTPGDYNLTVEVTTAAEVEIITQTITIFDLPAINSPITLWQCDDDTDGITDFNLREVEELITVDDPTLLFTYHSTLLDADADSSPLTNLTTFSNRTSSQVFVRVENGFGCYRIATINLEVSTTSIPTNFMLNFNECDTANVAEDDNNGIATFDFSSATQDLLALFPLDQNLAVTYYENLTDALAEENTINATNYSNDNSPFMQQIVVRIDNLDSNACLGLGFHITLIVDPLPEFDLTEIQYLCINRLPEPLVVTVENPQDDYIFEWRNEGGILLNTTSSTSSIELTETGDYFVTAITADNCERTKKFTIKPSNIATIQRIAIADDSENNSITIIVSGDGDYEFALNSSSGLYQDENIFEGVPGGIHTVYVRDKNGCGLVSQEVSVIAYPRFFTPNGDGFNDTWQILGIGLQPISMIYIFDRFGKVLAKLDATSEGWDGTYLGNEMPQSDYWFKVELEDGRVRKGHFSLIRR